MSVPTARRARPDDAATLQEITRAAFAAYPVDPPSGAVREGVDEVARELATDGGVVLERAGEIVAGLRFRPATEDGTADSTADGTVWLRRVAVRPDLQGSGLGGRLVVAAHQEAVRAGYVAARVGVRHGRPSALRFWRAHGYQALAEHGAAPDDLPLWTELGRALPVQLVVPTAEAMRDLGRRLATELRAGDLVVLAGALGAGKTTLAQGIGAGLGVRGAVTSPTFVIAREHPPLNGGRGLPLVHVDAYRLGGVAELDDLDLDSALADSVTLVEWGEGVAERLTEARLDVRISRPEGEAGEERTVWLDGTGERWTRTALLEVADAFAQQ